ncbi:MAG: PAS domain-containing protein, partial [Spirochaetia bacterium]|nr:PAS domain-containing protein [Spirochaetia bacterium]
MNNSCYFEYVKAMGGAAVSHVPEPLAPYSLLHIVHSALDPVLLLDHTWKVACINESASSVLGYQEADLIGFPIVKILPGWKESRSIVQTTFETGAVKKDRCILAVTVTIATWRTEQEHFHIALLHPGTHSSQNTEAVLASWELDVVQDRLQSSVELARLYGLDIAEFPGKYAELLKRIHPEDREYFDSAISRALQDGGYFNLDYRIIRNDGSVRLIEDRGEAFLNTSGQAIRLIALSRDVTGGTIENEELLKKISILNLLQQLAAAANEADDLDSLLQFTLDRVCAVSGWDAGHVWLWADADQVLKSSRVWYIRDEQVFKRFREVSSVTSFSSGVGIPGCVLASGRPQWFQRFSRDVDPRCDPAGIGNLHSVYAMPMLIREKIIGVMEFYISIDVPGPDAAIIEALSHAGSQIGRVIERVWSQEALQRSREHLRALAARLQAVREEERIRIAREIHDELGQLLTVLKIDLTLMRQNFEEGLTGPQTSQELLRMSKVSDSAIESVQRIASELRPMILDKLGFLEAIDWFCKDFSTRTGIACSLNVASKNLSPAEDHSIALFRIFQETLTNIARHAKASKVSITITDSPSSYLLTVQDNGLGIDHRQINAAKSLGLLGMRERAIALGGEVKISGKAGAGTLVS